MASYDCIVIGSGPGGYVAAIRAAQLGMKTAVVEKDKVGGRCLNYACIPAKAVLRTADVLQEVRDAGDFGLKVADPEVDYAAVMERRAKVIKTLTGGVAGLFKKNKIDYLEGAGALTGDGNVRVGDDEHEASKCVILATGSVPKGVPGADLGAGSSAPRRPGRSRRCRARWRSSAPARRAPRSRRPTRAWAPRSSSSRWSTACCPARTPRCRRSPSAASRSSASRCSPARRWRTSRRATRR